MSNNDDDRGGLVPVGDIAIDVPGVGRTLTAKRQAHHFTTLDQVTQLVAARDADPELGFMARLLALCSLPRTNPGDQHEFKRVNGPYTLYMTAGAGNKLPYGSRPRLLLAWVCSEAVRTQSRELILGDSLSEFMRRLGIYSTSGDKHTRLRNQMKRLFYSQIILVYKDAHGERFVNSPIADSGEFWWDAKHPSQASLWESKIQLGERFLSRNHHQPAPDQHENSQVDEAVAARPRPLPLAHLSHVQPHAPDAAHLDADVPAVRREPGQGHRPRHR